MCGYVGCKDLFIYLFIFFFFAIGEPGVEKLSVLIYLLNQVRNVDV